MSNHGPVNRRRFFRAALGELFERVQRAAEPVERVLSEFGAAAGADAAAPAKGKPRADAPSVDAPPAADAAPALRILRPPGALEEDQFVSQCCRCGACERVCPAQCIKLEPDGRGDGAPFIDVEEMSCVLCDGLFCMHNCPTGALLPTPREQIDMGTAEWRPDLCVRTHGQECTVCVDTCPVGRDAIRLDGNAIAVLEDGCTGCGVCEYQCPTRPRAIVVNPAAVRDRSVSD